MPATVFCDQSIGSTSAWRKQLADRGLVVAFLPADSLNDAIRTADPAVAVVSGADSAAEVRHANPSALILLLSDSPDPSPADAAIPPSAGDSAIAAVILALARTAEAESRLSASTDPSGDLANTRLAAIIESSDDAIISVGLDGIITSWNTGAQRIFGYTTDEAIGHHVTLIVPETRWEEEHDLLSRIRTGERIDHYQTVRRAKDGRDIDISLTVSPIRDRAGAVVGISKVARDIGSRLEAAITDARLGAIVESSDDAIIGKDLTGTITSWNNGAQRIFGYTPTEAIGRHITLIIPADLRHQEDQILARVRKGERIDHFQTTRVAKDGRRLDLSLTVSPVRAPSGQIIGASKIARDITEQRLSQERLRRSEERLRLALEAGRIGVWEWNVVDNRVECSDRIYDFCGVSRDSFGATFEAFRSLIYSDDAERFASSLRTAFEQANDYACTFRIRRPSGEVRWLDTRAEIFRDDHGAPTRMIGVTADVTDQHLAEEQLRASEAAARARSVELARSNAELQDFAYVASHDLKEPLRGISSYTQILLEDYGHVIDEEGREKLRALTRLPLRMDALLDALLDYARLGRERLHFEDLDPAVVIDSAVDSLRATLDAAHATVTVSSPLLRLHADRILLTQVIANLIANGVKYNHSPAPAITISADESGALVISDNGIGIPLRHQHSIFRMFKRLHARDAFGGGTGVGLAIVKKIVELHGGRISIDSAEGRGTTFRLHLPLTVAAPPAPTREALAHS